MALFDDYEERHARSWEIDSTVEGSTAGGSTVADPAENRSDTEPLISLLSAQTSERPESPRVPPGFSAPQDRYPIQPLVPQQSTASGTTSNTAYSAYLTRPFRSNSTFDPNAYRSTSRQGVPLSQRRSTSTPQIGSSSQGPRGRNGPGRAIVGSSSSVEIITSNVSRPPYGSSRGGRGGTTVHSQAPSRGGYSGRGGISTMRALHGAQWAKNEGLITTRRAKHMEKTALKDRERDQYKEAPTVDEHFPAIGYYTWPIEKKSPEELLGSRLQALDPLREAHSVYIEFDTAMQCLVVSSRDSQQAMEPIIDGVRRAIQHSHAQGLSANPVYIVVPPTSSAMRPIVRPRVARLVPKKLAKHLELAGDELTDKKEEWKDARPAMVQQNRVRFRDTLVKKLVELEPLKGWMRMRVFFGYVELSAYRRGFAASQVTFETFADMVQNPRQTGSFDKKIGNGITVMKLREKIIELDRFGPVQGRVFNLEHVAFKNTEVIFVTTPSGDKIRIEAEIDRTYETDSGDGEYQTGSIRLFHHKEGTENDNSRIEITTIDVEREIDWKLEVITDNEIMNGAQVFYQMIKDSVSHRSPVRIDPLGLDYPQVTPYSTSELHINSVTVKSVVQYKVQASGYVIEIAIYRGWEGSNTRGEPTMQAAVSLFHPNWDMEMEAIEHTTRVRDFGPGLRNLFDNGTDDGKGMEDFLAEVETIQGFLADAIRVTAYQAAQAKARADAEAAAAAGGNGVAGGIGGLRV